MLFFFFFLRPFDEIARKNVLNKSDIQKKKKKVLQYVIFFSSAESKK